MVQISVANMHCGGCAKRVRATLGQVAPDVVPEFDLERRRLSLDIPETDIAPVLAALIADGWDAQRHTA